MSMSKRFLSFTTRLNYEQLRLNVGDAMNPTTGIFTAPRAGKYHFTCSGLAKSVTPFRVDLLLENGMVGSNLDKPTE